MDAKRMDARHSIGEPRVLISREALLHNVGVVRQSIDENVRICAIIKADAYGHGVDIVADTFCNFSADGSLRPMVDAVAVASLDEAAALPEIAPPILIFRPIENTFISRQRQKLEAAVRAGWTLTVCSHAAVDDLARIAGSCGKRAAVQIMLDTGMTRSGVSPRDFDALLARINSRTSLRLAGVCTHFASAEEVADPFTQEQLLRFESATADVQDRVRTRVVRHAANSAGVFFHPNSHYDMVRPGLALYGIDPTCRPNINRPLRPALKWIAPLIDVQTVRKGTGVGYGQTWTAPRDTRIGLIPIGYADGYPRSLSNVGSVLLQNKLAPVVGRVSMDLTTVDLCDVPAARIGDEVTLLDDDPLSPVSVYNVAKWTNTLPYEVFCRIGPRVDRVVVEPKGAEMEEAETERTWVPRMPR